MASLALIVSIILGFLILSGPFVYVLSLIRFLPNWIIWLFAVPVFLIGLYWIISMFTIWPMNLIGLIPILFCWMAIKKRKTK